MEEKKRILITGASGFIGGFIVEEALQRGYDVWAGVRANSSHSRLQDKRIHFIDLKYDDKDALVKQIKEFARQNGAWHYVVHNAGITKTNNVANFYKVNSRNTQTLIESLDAACCRPQKFVLMSSLSSYGPTNESTFEPIKLTDTQNPNTEYGKSKLEAENFLRKQNKFPYIIMRPTGVYGPADKDYLMEIKSIKSGFDFKVGMTPQRITFIYVKDLAKAIFLSIENENIINKSYFVADGDVYTDTEFAKLVQRLLGKRFVFHVRIPLWISHIACLCSGFIGQITGRAMTLNADKYKILKQRNWICETDPIYKDLQFKPEYNLEKGLKETIAYDKAHGLL